MTKIIVVVIVLVGSWYLLTTFFIDNVGKPIETEVNYYYKIRNMKNETVGELIKRLQVMDENAVVCGMELDDGYDMVFSTFEICKEFKNVTYIDDNGDDVKGNVVSLY